MNETCSRCGSAVAAEYRFCDRCGAALARSPQIDRTPAPALRPVLSWDAGRAYCEASRGIIALSLACVGSVRAVYVRVSRLEFYDREERFEPSAGGGAGTLVFDAFRPETAGEYVVWVRIETVSSDYRRAFFRGQFVLVVKPRRGAPQIVVNAQGAGAVAPVIAANEYNLADRPAAAVPMWQPVPLVEDHAAREQAPSRFTDDAVLEYVDQDGVRKVPLVEGRLLRCGRRKNSDIRVLVLPRCAKNDELSIERIRREHFGLLARTGRLLVVRRNPAELTLDGKIVPSEEQGVAIADGSVLVVGGVVELRFEYVMKGDCVDRFRVTHRSLASEGK